MDKLKSTKVQGFWFVLIVSSLMLWFGKIGGGEWVAILTLAFSIFSLANQTQKYILEGKRNEPKD